LHIKKKRLKRR